MESGSRPSQASLSPSDGSRKRARSDHSSLYDRRVRARLLPLSRGTYSQRHMDPIACGLVSEAEAERLFDLCVYYSVFR